MYTRSYFHACLARKEFTVLSECRGSLAGRGRNPAFEAVSQCSASRRALPSLYGPWTRGHGADGPEQSRQLLRQAVGAAEQFQNGAMTALPAARLVPLHAGSAAVPQLRPTPWRQGMGTSRDSSTATARPYCTDSFMLLLCR